MERTLSPTTFDMFAYLVKTSPLTPYPVFCWFCCLFPHMIAVNNLVGLWHPVLGCVCFLSHGPQLSPMPALVILFGSPYKYECPWALTCCTGLSLVYRHSLTRIGLHCPSRGCPSCGHPPHSCWYLTFSLVTMNLYPLPLPFLLKCLFHLVPSSGFCMRKKREGKRRGNERSISSVFNLVWL